MDSLYISRVVIKNFRNFRDLDVNLQHKSVIVGENNTGKTNFIRALQLILDPALSDEDRMLTESDFNDTLDKPMENNQEIQIQIYISNFRSNIAIMTMLSDATVLDDNGNEVLLLSYKFFPHVDEFGNKEYQFETYMKNDMSRKFGSRERKYLNIKVIKALRDVELELRNAKKSPVRKLLEDYKIERNIIEHGYFIGKYTFEVDMMECSITENGKKSFISTFSSLVESEKKRRNFESRLNEKDYGFCLQRIEDPGIGKGRFAQILSDNCCIDNCPDYVKNAIEYIYSKVDE